MPRSTLTRAIEFPAGHRYYRAEWSAERNASVFGACSRAPGHGHNYRVEVTIEGELDPDSGMVIDLLTLDAALEEAVLRPMDHAHLNDLPEFSDGLIPTGENLARVIWDRLSRRELGDGRLKRVRVIEDRNLWADYSGP